MLWWWWVLLGIALLFAEVVTPGAFVALFFGLSAILVGALTAAGILGPPWLQWLLFSAIAVFDLALLRRPLRARFHLGGPGPAVDSLAGERGTVLEPVGPGGEGKVEVRGSTWSARGDGPASLEPGQRCVVSRVDGLTLWVRPE